MIIKFTEKFTDKHLDEKINSIYENFNKNKDDYYVFDLIKLEYIANQELLVLSSLFSMFIQNKVEFEVVLYEKGLSISEIPSRVRRQLIELWVVWRIWKLIPSDKYYVKYFGLDGTFIESLQKEENYYPESRVELYDRHGVTPFIHLDFIENYSANEIQNRVKRIFKLSEAIQEILYDNDCFHPFTSDSLSVIISEELYLNFLDHSLHSSFEDFTLFASMSISVKRKRDDKLYLNKLNFESEQLPESKSFFYDSFSKEFYNRSYIEFSFLDFGSGIPNTLRSEYANLSDNEILKHAFNHDSSRHPISIVDSKADDYIPRGLYDALTIVRRYKGLLVARSNYGKILFDFNESDDIEKAFKIFGNNDFFFPGTLISLYIPAIENESLLNESSIKPQISFEHINPRNKRYVNINQVLKNIPKGKEKLYSYSLQELKNAILFNNNEPTIVYLSFLGSTIEDRVARKVLIFLLTDYQINIRANVVLIHSPKKEIINSVSKIINSLNSVYKKYKIHPLPIINYESAKEELYVQWLGVYDKKDAVKLNDLLYTEFSLAKSDFNESSYIEGHVLSFDTYGNLISHFPNRGELIEIFTGEEDAIISQNFLYTLEQSKGIVRDNGKGLYLCNGNYFQKEYIEINNIINSKEELESITNIFFIKLESKIDNIHDFHFIGITSTSNKILKSFVNLNLISNERSHPYENYHSFEKEMNELTIESHAKYILICDVISTGFLTKKLANKLIELGSVLSHVGVLVSVIDLNFRKNENYLNSISDKIISLLEYEINKYETDSDEIKTEIGNKKIIRINPYTNIPIRLSFDETNYNDSIIFHSTVEYDESLNEIIFKNEFLDSVDDENLKVGYFKFNNVIHPYFFDTNPILDNLDVDILKNIFIKIDNPKLKTDKVQIFYPRDSGIKSNTFFTNLKSGLGNDNVEEIEIDRINTSEGWRFPHNSKHLSSKVDDNLCLIIDDGTSTGDSLIQMIDEISFYNAKEIILLCFIGRINDHKREFFSRLSSIKVQRGNSVALSIFFATHWHIPTYYLDSNPIIKETNWLRELIKVTNAPNSIKKIAERILEEIKPKKENFKDYKYLPKIIGTKKTPKKELIKRREEIGKVIGYRLYKESFNYFNAFVKKYSLEKKDEEVDRYKEIELICACFIYEPYLYEKLSLILPDVTFLIEQFVRYLVFSYDNYENHKSYDWDKKDVVHLFFIVFKDEKLIAELTKTKFNKLIKFTNPSESCLDYVLYKLSRYFPISNNHSSNKFIRSYILNQLIYQSQQETLNEVERNKIEVFNHFIATLSINESVEDILNKILSEYSKINPKSIDYHNKNLKVDKQVLKELLTDIHGKIYKDLDYSEDKQSFIKYSKRLVCFLENILGLSSTHRSFFIDDNIYNDINSNNENSLRMLHKEFNDLVYSNGNKFNVEKCKNILDKIYANFINNKSNLFDLFQQIHTDNVLLLLKESIHSGYNIIGDINQYQIDFSVYIPKHFMSLIFKEVNANLRHSSGDVNISITKKHPYFDIEILTTIKKGKKGRSNGTVLFSNLNNSPFDIKYKSEIVNDKKQFLQIFKCKEL